MKKEPLPNHETSTLLSLSNPDTLPFSFSEIKRLEKELVAEKKKRQIEMSYIVLRVQETERAHLGQELHDNINQVLSTVKLLTETLHPINKKEQEIKKKITDNIALVIEEIRKLSKQLVIPYLKEKGLEESIRSLIEDIHIATPIHFEFAMNNALDQLSCDKKISLFRIIQEQTKNILNHSHATKAGISLSIESKNVVLNIWDNGEGFLPQKICKGIGLSNIRERVAIYNGKLEILSAPHKGCRLIVKIPLK